VTTPQPIIAIGRSRYLYDSIRHLTDRGHRVAAVVTDDAYAEYDVTAEHLEALADEVGASFLKAKSLSREIGFLTDVVTRERVQAAISVNWRYKLDATVLDLFPSGVLNFHLGSLPDYKGNATANWAIIAGEDHIYANVHAMAPELDAGDVLARASIPITPSTYVADLITAAEQVAPSLFEEALARVADEPGAYEVGGTTAGLRCYPRLPEDGQIDWSRSAEDVCRLVRASSRPFNGAFSYVDGERTTIWRARAIPAENPFLAMPGHVLEVRQGSGTVLVACGDGILELEEIEQEGIVGAPAETLHSIRSRFRFFPHLSNLDSKATT
jgi:methionyl-tRNA formyltransferase